MRRGLLWVLAAVVALPHELGHALPARLAGLSVTVELAPEWEGRTVLGRFNAAVDETTPRWLVVAVAVAPLPLYLAVAALLGAVVPPESPLAPAVFLLVSAWASLSEGDLAVALSPTAARGAGRFVVPPTRWDWLAVPGVPATAVLVAALVLR